MMVRNCSSSESLKSSNNRFCFGANDFGLSYIECYLIATESRLPLSYIEAGFFGQVICKNLEFMEDFFQKNKIKVNALLKSEGMMQFHAPLLIARIDHNTQDIELFSVKPLLNLIKKVLRSHHTPIANFNYFLKTEIELFKLGLRKGKCFGWNPLIVDQVLLHIEKLKSQLYDSPFSLKELCFFHLKMKPPSKQKIVETLPIDLQDELANFPDRHQNDIEWVTIENNR